MIPDWGQELQLPSVLLTAFPWGWVNNKPRARLSPSIQCAHAVRGCVKGVVPFDGRVEAKGAQTRTEDDESSIPLARLAKTPAGSWPDKPPWKSDW